MYTIYALIDPRDALVRYVGMTDSVYRRFREHVKGKEKNPAKNAWVQELQEVQIVFAMQSLDIAESYEQAREIEKVWIDTLLAQGHPLFNIFNVEAPASKPSRISTNHKLKIFDGKRVRHNARKIDNILDYYLLTDELPDYVSERQRYHYRHHPRLEDRKKLLKIKRRDKK